MSPPPAIDPVQGGVWSVECGPAAVILIIIMWGGGCRAHGGNY